MQPNEQMAMLSEIPRGRAGASEGARVGIPHATAHAHRRSACTALVARLPIQFTDLTIESLGSIDARPGYHAFKSMWPVGFLSHRVFFSVRGADVTSKYECRVGDGGESGPLFIVREEGSMFSASGKTSGAAWEQVVAAAGERHGKATVGKPLSGPMAFGFGIPEVAAAIEGMDGADACVKYYFQEQVAAGAVFP